MLWNTECKILFITSDTPQARVQNIPKQKNASMPYCLLYRYEEVTANMEHMVDYLRDTRICSNHMMLPL